MPRYPDVAYQTELVYRYVQQAAEVYGITSANAYYRWMHEQGLPVARAVVREGWSEYWSKQQYRTLIERWPDERPIPRAWIVDRESGARDNYVAMYHLSGVDSATGQEISRAVYVGVDRQPSKAALEEELWKILGTYVPELDLTTARIELEYVAHVKGRTW